VVVIIVENGARDAEACRGNRRCQQSG
jgi:hypothetical protein